MHHQLSSFDTKWHITFLNVALRYLTMMRKSVELEYFASECSWIRRAKWLSRKPGMVEREPSEVKAFIANMADTDAGQLRTCLVAFSRASFLEAHRVKDGKSCSSRPMSQIIFVQTTSWADWTDFILQKVKEDNGNTQRVKVHRESKLIASSEWIAFMQNFMAFRPIPFSLSLTSRSKLAVAWKISQ